MTWGVGPGNESQGTRESLGQRHQHLGYDQINFSATGNWSYGDWDAGVCSAPREGTGKSSVGPRASAEKDRVWGRQAPGLIKDTEVEIEQIYER